MTTITEDGGRTNIYAKEPRMYYTTDYGTPMENAEKTNGRAAMMGFMFAIASYAATGQIIPGLF
jgi:hypothetical protein